MQSEPIRVLHVLGALNPGGVESWLLQVVRHIDRERFQLDFLVHTEQPAAYDAEIRALGSRILACPGPQRPWSYGPRLQRILQEFGPYDVVHSHVHDFSGYVLRLARQAGVPMRIAHSHCDLSHIEQQSGFFRRRYLRLMKGWMHKHATAGLGCSRRAAQSLFGADWESDPRYRLFFCGIDPSPFEKGGPSSRLREEFGFPPDAFVVGHVGRFAEQKNHRFLIEIAAELIRRHPSARLVLVGDGPLRPEIEQQVREAGIAEQVVFAGLRRDVPQMMTNLFDAFLLPSHFEGLPIVMLEAQAAGLPCVYSNVVDEDTVVIPELMRSESLAEPASHWADALWSLHQKYPVRLDTALNTFSESPFHIRRCVEGLEELYAGARQRDTFGAGRINEGVLAPV
jgi:glycosyltransferase involved in cell wall biosynthesis